MTAQHPTALVADDEPLLREALVRQLGRAWPALQVVAQARNGREALQQFEECGPDVCFLDVHMPGLSGIEAARQIGDRAQLVFVTAYDHYAVQAFEQGALDYLVKPVEPERLAATVARLQARLQTAAAVPGIEHLLQRLAAQLQHDAGRATLRWLRAQVGHTVRLIAVEEIDYLRSDAKYTRIAWRGDSGRPGEAMVGTTLKELVAQLDATRFAQVHRSVVVNLGAVSHIVRGAHDTASIHLRGRDETLPVSRRYMHLFRTM
jgi:DNA-binding LytR/AlgR family response regulator